VITVGSPLIGSFSASTIGGAFAIFNTKVSGFTTSPVNGAIVGWHVTGAAGGPFYLRVLNPVGTEFTGVGTSAPATPLTTGIEHFAASLPIKEGQTIALEHTNSGDAIGTIASSVGGSYEFFAAPLADGATAAPAAGPGLEIGFNAEVKPAPVITALGTTAGPVGGGTSVSVAGTDLDGTTSVKFGGVPADFVQGSENLVVATSPAAAGAVAVPVTVTTVAGTATSGQFFAYQSPVAPVLPAPVVVKCVVPNIVGKHLKAAKKKIRARHCTVGNVVKLEGVTGKTATVVKQNPKPGKVRAIGSKVNFKLGS
jgi:hypothetical protein